MRRLVILLTVCLWPLSLFLNNNFPDFLKTIVPGITIVFSYLMIKRGSSKYLLPFLVIPFVEPKLAVFPVFVSIFTIFLTRKKTTRTLWLFMFASLLILFFQWKSFYGQTIFTRNIEAEHVLIEKGNLYHSVFLARVFQNKLRIYLDQFSNNMFSITDPNNYFFGFHPRELVRDNENLKKFPFVSLIFVLLGVYYYKGLKTSKFIVLIFISSLVSLSILKIFDRADFVLWLPLSLVMIHGIYKLEKWPTLKLVLYILFFVFATFQLLRLFLGYT